MNNKVDFLPRFLAALIDGVIAWIPFFIPVIGPLFGALYLLFKDSIMYKITNKEEWKNKSIGKKILNLVVIKLDGEYTDMESSARRNIPLTIGSFISIIPLIGWFIGPIVAFIFGLVELILILTDDNGRRLGDRWAQTQVLKVPSDNKNITVI